MTSRQIRLWNAKYNKQYHFILLKLLVEWWFGGWELSRLRRFDVAVC